MLLRRVFSPSWNQYAPGIIRRHCGSNAVPKRSFRSVLIKSSNEKSQGTKNILLLKGDRGVGNMLDRFLLNAVFYYDAPLESHQIETSLEAFVDRFPELAGRIDGSYLHLSNAGLRYSVRDACPGSAIEKSHLTLTPTSSLSLIQTLTLMGF